ncbi:MAG: hypothetical protein DRR19_30485 [Candidatus Parabeggiatoa sp. nov. 1]|nr:MAG: hypothetical protein DRR19_30485 [Gammaproteobacteria bacterium]
MINYNELIQYAALFIIPIFLMGAHNWLISHLQPKTDQKLVTTHRAAEKMGLSLALFIGTVLLMFFIAPSAHLMLNVYSGLAIGFALISSFLIIPIFLSSLLKEISRQQLGLKFLYHQHLWLALFFIIATELLVLYWLKEVNNYAQQQFLVFMLGYSALIIMGGFRLAFPKPKRQTQPIEWRLKIVALIDPIIIVCLAYILINILLKIYNYLYA